IAGRALVLFRTLMRVVLDHPDSSLPIHGDAGRRDDVGFLGNKLHDQPVVGWGRWLGISVGNGEDEESDQPTMIHHPSVLPAGKRSINQTTPLSSLHFSDQARLRGRNV